MDTIMFYLLSAHSIRNELMALLHCPASPSVFVFDGRLIVIWCLPQSSLSFVAVVYVGCNVWAFIPISKTFQWHFKLWDIHPFIYYYRQGGWEVQPAIWNIRLNWERLWVRVRTRTGANVCIVTIKCITIDQDEWWLYEIIMMNETSTLCWIHKMKMKYLINHLLNTRYPILTVYALISWSLITIFSTFSSLLLIIRCH